MSEKGSSSQSAAFDVLRRYDDALRRWAQGCPLDRLQADSASDRRLANTLFTTFRHLGVLDWIIDRHATGRVRPRLRRVLRWTVCHHLYLSSLPTPVAVDTAVRYTRKRRHAREAGFLNAVLRNITAVSADRHRADIENNAPAHLHLELGRDLYQAWKSRFSEQDLEQLSHLFQQPPPLIARLRPGHRSLPPGTRTLTAPAWAPEASLCEITDPDRFFASGLVSSGACYVQDPSTLMAPSLLAPGPGERVADFCAAPGGKTLYLRDIGGGTVRLLAADRSTRRLDRLRENLVRDVACALVAADAVRLPFGTQSFDGVMLDVPCSNTGVIRRRPDVKWRFSRESLKRLTALQSRILEATAGTVRTGGRLVYSTCSLEPAENEDQIGAFLSRHAGFRLHEQHTLLPNELHDGAYAALLVKQSA